MSADADAGLVWAKFLTDQALEQTSRLILKPTQFRPRTRETVDIIDDVLRRQVTLELASGEGAHLVPIASPKRDRLVDIIRIKPSQDVMTTILVRRHAALFGKRLLELRAQALGLDPRHPIVERATSVSSVSPDDSREVRRLLDFLALVKRGTVTESTAQRESLVLARDEIFMKLFRWLRGTSPLLVPCVPRTPLFVIEFEVRSGISAVDTRSIPRAVRSGLGLTTYDFEFPARSALFTESYHFEYKAPAGHYIRKCEVFGSRVDVQRDRSRISEFAKRSYLPASPAFATFASGDVDGNIHVQIGDSQLDSDRPRFLAIGVKVSERPAGQIFAAAVRWAIVLTVIVAVRDYGPQLVEAQGTFGTTLLLALPGVVGISSLILSPTEVSRSRSIGPRSLSFLAGAVSIIASLGFVRWSLDYMDCVHQHPNLNADADCSGEAPVRIADAFNAIEWVGFLVLAFLLVLVIVNIGSYFQAERATPQRKSYLPETKDGVK